MMKKILLFSMILASVNTALLAEDNHLYIQPNAGETLDWSVPTLQKMTFQDGQVVLTKKDGTTAYAPISTVKRMYISTPSAQGMEQIADKTPLLQWNGDMLHLSAQPGTLVVVYNVAGAVVKREKLTDNGIDFQGLGKGLYIVNVGGQVLKTIKK